MNKIIKFLLKLGVSAGFLAWIILNTDWGQVLFYLGEIEPWKLIIYVILVFVGIAISAYKWQLLAEYKNIRHSFSDYYRYYLTGAFINNFMPSFIGGDTFRAYQIGRPEKKYLEAASSVMADRITGLIGMTILAIFFSLVNWRATLQNDVLLLINLILIIFLIGEIVIAKTSDHRIWKKIFNYLPQKISRLIQEIQGYSGNVGILKKAIGWGIVFQFIGVALVNYILFWSLDIKIGLPEYLSGVFMISVVTSIPISINNIGIKEWAYVTIFGIYGLDVSALVTVAILSRFIQMVISFFALPTYLRIKKEKTKAVA